MATLPLLIEMAGLKTKYTQQSNWNLTQCGLETNQRAHIPSQWKSRGYIKWTVEQFVAEEHKFGDATFQDIWFPVILLKDENVE